MRENKAEKRSNPTLLGDIVAGVTGPLLARPEARIFALWQQWDALVGERLASHVEPIKLTARGQLHLRVDAPVWMDQLHYLKAELMARFNAALGLDAVQDVRFKVGSLNGLPEPPRPLRSLPRPLPQSTPEERHRATALTAHLGHPPLREVAYRLCLRILADGR